MQTKTDNISKYKTLELTASFLAHSHGIEQNFNTVDQFISLLESNWDNVRTFCGENRVWTNVIAYIAESPEIVARFNPERRKEIGIIHITHLARAEKDKKQLLEIDNCHKLIGTNLLLMKGATRLFDDLYPSNAHRKMNDIDIYFEDAACIKGFASLGYDCSDSTRGKIGDFDDDFITVYGHLHHHLPPISSQNYQKPIELHQSLIHKNLPISMRKHSIENASRVSGTNCFTQLSILDQLILLIIHSRFADRYTSFSSSRLRGLWEGYLLYRKLSTDERTEFDQHFDEQGAISEVNLWKYICYRLFNAPEFSNLESFVMQQRYNWHRKTSHNGLALSINFGYHSIRRLLFFRLRNPLERKELRRKLKESYRWKLFLSRITRIR